VFIDEIEFFLSDEPVEVPQPDLNDVSVYPNPSSGILYLYFNMQDPQGEEVVVELMNTQGTFITKEIFPQTLNQIYTVELPGLAAGIYYLRIRSKSLNTTRKVILVP
jgi:hypothetical protein